MAILTDADRALLAQKYPSQTAALRAAESEALKQCPFKPGDVVQFKQVSGPWMTVERRRINSHAPGHFLIEAVWFDKRRRVQRDTFDSFALEAIRPPPVIVEKGRTGL